MKKFDGINNDLVIFYADDDEDDREFFCEAIDELYDSSKLVTLEDGDGLLNALRNPPPTPSLVFLDLNMPGKTGFDVLKEIRTLERFKNIPVIVVSTSSDEKTISITKELGANYYIPKPTDYDDLKKSLKYALNINWETFKPHMFDFVYRKN